MEWHELCCHIIKLIAEENVLLTREEVSVLPLQILDYKESLIQQHWIIL